ncbi:transcriptional repressor [Candidatus Peregrinibacteria bacterium]|nr:transcriptional repressor [Candidatus Peregrinibacteria bacterium]
MKDVYQQIAFEKLRDAGLKITKPRQMIVDFLASSDTALSPYEVQNLLQKKGIKSDVVTIYRVFEVLENLSLVHKVLAFNGYIRCHTEELKSLEEICHHYLLCKSCKRVEEVEGEDLTNLEKKIEKNYGFKIRSHYLEFMGVCKNCKKKKGQA